MNENELKELPVELVTLVPHGATLVFQMAPHMTDKAMHDASKSLAKVFPDHKCVLLRDAKLYAAIERPML